MKKILTAIFLPLLLASALGQYNIPDQAKLSQLTGTAPVGLYIDQVYAVSINIDPSRGLYQKVSTNATVGNATLTISDKGRWGEYLDIEIANDAGGARTITFGTGFTAATSTLVGTISKSAVISFRSNGSTWMEAYRSTGGSGGSGTPAGSSGDLQYNNAGSFGAYTPGAGVATFLQTPTSANLATAVTNETGSGALVFATSPTFTTSLLTPAVISTAADPADAGLLRLGNTDLIEWEANPTGTDITLGVNSSNQFVFSNSILSPTFITPALGTPASGVATNLTGTAAGLTAGNVTTNANLTGAVTSVGNAASLGSFSSANLLSALTDETGTGLAVFGTSPAITTSLTSPSATFALLNVTPQTINFAGGVTTLNIGNASTTTNLLGTLALNPSGTVAGNFQMGQGTLPALGTTAATWSGPASITSHNVVVPGSVGSTGLMQWSVSGTTATISPVTALPSNFTASTKAIGDATTSVATDGFVNNAALSPPTVDATTTHALVLADGFPGSNYITMTSASANTVNIPLNATQAFPVGTTIYVKQGGTGATSITTTGGVTPNSNGNLLTFPGQNTVVTLVKNATDTWDIYGTGPVVTYPTTTAINTLLYASAANVESALATANSSVLVTSSGGVPSLSTALPSTITATTASTGDSSSLVANDAFVDRAIMSTPTVDATSNHTLSFANGNPGSNLISMTSASANTVTIPLNATTGFAIGRWIYVTQSGAGATSLVATGGVTINATNNVLTFPGKDSMVRLLKTGTDTWSAYGTAPVYTTSQHFISSGTAPTIAAGAGAGTSPTVSIAGTDTAGAITVTSGTLPSVSSAIVTITFNAAYGTAPYVVLWPANANASTLTFLPYVTSTTTTFVVNASTVALGAATTYVYNYHVIQ